MGVADSTEVKAKIEKLERIKTEAKALQDKYSGGALPDDADLKLTVLQREGKALVAEIQEDRRREERATDIAGIDEFLNRPQHKIPHGINGDQDDEYHLKAAGWEVKAGVWCAPTSLGTHQPMYPVEVLGGDVPDADPDTQRYIRRTRATIGADYKTAYMRHLRLAAQVGDSAQALTMLSGLEHKALSEGSDTGGGFLVPPDLQAEILARTAQMSVMMRHARTVTTNRDRVIFPAVAPASTSSSIYSSGFVGGWAGETPSASDTDPGFQQFEISVKKARVSTRVSNDFVADASADILGFLGRNGAENLSLVLDNGFINGNGSALQPLGILNAGATTKDVEGSTSNTISNTTSNTGSAPKLIDLVYAVPAQYRTNASWLMCSAIAGKTLKLVDGNGRTYWPELAGSGFAPAQPTLFGKPVDYSDWMPDDGTDANKVYVFGDLSQYIVVQRTGMTTVVLRERYADTDQVGIILFTRVGGALWNSDAIRYGIV
jgi:HK97 family phage major capsid protein